MHRLLWSFEEMDVKARSLWAIRSHGSRPLKNHNGLHVALQCTYARAWSDPYRASRCLPWTWDKCWPQHWPNSEARCYGAQQYIAEHLTFMRFIRTARKFNFVSQNMDEAFVSPPATSATSSHSWHTVCLNPLFFMSVADHSMLPLALAMRSGHYSSMTSFGALPLFHVIHLFPLKFPLPVTSCSSSTPHCWQLLPTALAPDTCSLSCSFTCIAANTSTKTECAWEQDIYTDRTALFPRQSPRSSCAHLI